MTLAVTHASAECRAAPLKVVPVFFQRGLYNGDMHLHRRFLKNGHTVIMRRLNDFGGPMAYGVETETVGAKYVHSISAQTIRSQ